MRIGYVGLGAMERPMAINLVNAGIDLVVCDTDDTKTAILAQRGAPWRRPHEKPQTKAISCWLAFQA